VLGWGICNSIVEFDAEQHGKGHMRNTYVALEGRLCNIQQQLGFIAISPSFDCLTASRNFIAESANGGHRAAVD
jgi:hypothetical protein